jgi:hypothetical protein
MNKYIITRNDKIYYAKNIKELSKLLNMEYYKLQLLLKSDCRVFLIDDITIEKIYNPLHKIKNLEELKNHVEKYYNKNI